MAFNAHKIKVHILVVTDYELYIIERNRELTSQMWFPVGPCITPNYPILKLYQEPIKWSLHLPYMPLESTLSRVDL